MAPRERPVASSRRATVAPSYPYAAKQLRAPPRICSRRSAFRSSEILGIGSAHFTKPYGRFIISHVNESAISAGLMPVKKSAVSALVLGETISVIGTRMTYLALPWFVLVTTGSPGKMSLVLAVEIAPMAVLGIPSGTVVAKLGARSTMLVADFARAPLIMALPVLHALGALSFGLVLAIVALLGVFMAPYFASQRVILPELVGEDEKLMAQANSLIEGGASAATLAGPGLAGIL